ncbi:hypothetical protein BSKO_05976 [Bryopsis sp. KO-2023]|nr:hypothetical protein BSKO_05976 [Bryopsis sp. KO-2023]
MDTEPARIRRGTPRGRGRRGRGGGRRYSDKHQPALSTNADRYVESGDEGEDPNIPVSKSEGQDLESLLHNLHLTEWGAYSHHRILVNELNREPPLATDGSHPKELALDMSSLAISLGTLPLHEVLDIDPKYFQETETVKTQSGRVSCRLVLEDPAAVATKEVEGKVKDAVGVNAGADSGRVSGVGNDVIDGQVDVINDAHDVIKDAHDVIKDAHDVTKDAHDVIKDAHDVIKDGHDVIKDAHDVIKDANIHQIDDDDDSGLSDDFDLFLDDVPSSHPTPKRPAQSSAPTSNREPTEHHTHANGGGVADISQTASKVKDGGKRNLNEVSGARQPIGAGTEGGKKDSFDDFSDASSDDLDALLDMSRGGKRTDKGGASLESWMDSL